MVKNQRKDNLIELSVKFFQCSFFHTTRMAMFSSLLMMLSPAIFRFFSITESKFLKSVYSRALANPHHVKRD